jgi:hypothetical protein
MQVIPVNERMVNKKNVQNVQNFTKFFISSRKLLNKNSLRLKYSA